IYLTDGLLGLCERLEEHQLKRRSRAGRKITDRCKIPLILEFHGYRCFRAPRVGQHFCRQILRDRWLKRACQNLVFAYEGGVNGGGLADLPDNIAIDSEAADHVAEEDAVLFLAEVEWPH